MRLSVLSAGHGNGTTPMQGNEVARQYIRQKTMSNERIYYMIFNWTSNLVGIKGRGLAGRAQKAFVELDTLNVSEQSNASEFIIMTIEM